MRNLRSSAQHARRTVDRKKTGHDQRRPTHELRLALPASRRRVGVRSRLATLQWSSSSLKDLQKETEMDAYDLAGGSWQSRAPILTKRAGAAVGVIGTRIIVVGGEGNAASITRVFPQTELYDTVTGAWSAGPLMKTPRHGTGGAVLNGVLYVPGGATVEGFGATAVSEMLVP
jgi:hypothetical protein